MSVTAAGLYAELRDSNTSILKAMYDGMINSGNYSRSNPVHFAYEAALEAILVERGVLPVE